MILLSIIVVITFCSMEFVAWFSHKYIMHGFLWTLHRDHHVKIPGQNWIEKNDSFFVIFATPAIICFAVGMYNAPLALAIGIGITLYGLVYFFVHDLFIHQRIKVLRNTKNKYLLAIRRAHKVHHKHLQKEDGECFGMLVVPTRFFKNTK